MRSVAFEQPYRGALEVWRSGIGDPLRLLQFLGVLIILGYGARLDNFSPFKVWFLENLVGSMFGGVDIIMLLLAVLEIIRRLVRGDPWVNRSPIGRSAMIVLLVLALVPFVRMLVVEGGLRLPLEMMGVPPFIFCLFLFTQLFERRHLPLMLAMIIIAGTYKLLEGVAIWVTRGISWGLLTGWRDADLLALLVMGGVFAVVVRDEGDTVYRWVRRALLFLFPIAVLIFIACVRRSYMLGIAVALIGVVLFAQGIDRRRILRMIPIVVVAAIAAAAVTGMSVGDRIEAVAEPGTEGSAAYRFIEVYNVSRMILERPLFGWPWGVEWVNYTNVELDKVSGIMPHNAYLYVAWRGGLLGLVVWIGFLVAVVRMHRRTIRQARTPLERFASLWLLAQTFTVMAASIGMPLFSDRMQGLFAFTIVTAGLLPGAFRAPERRQQLPG